MASRVLSLISQVPGQNIKLSTSQTRTSIYFITLMLPALGGRGGGHIMPPVIYLRWGNVHKFRVNGQIIGRVITFGRRNLSPLWGYYCFRLDFEHFFNSTKKSGRGQTPTPSIWQCQYFESAWPSYPFLTLFLTGPTEKGCIGHFKLDK